MSGDVTSGLATPPSIANRSQSILEQKTSFITSEGWEMDEECLQNIQRKPELDNQNVTVKPLGDVTQLWFPLPVRFYNSENR